MFHGLLLSSFLRANGRFGSPVLVGTKVWACLRERKSRSLTGWESTGSVEARALLKSYLSAHWSTTNHSGSMAPMTSSNRTNGPSVTQVCPNNRLRVNRRTRCDRLRTHTQPYFTNSTVAVFRSTFLVCLRASIHDRAWEWPLPVSFPHQARCFRADAGRGPPRTRSTSAKLILITGSDCLARYPFRGS